MSHLLDEVLAQAANGSPAVVALSSESVAVLLLASGFLDRRSTWLDRRADPMDEVTDADWDAIEKLVGNLYEEIMHPVLAVGAIQLWAVATPPTGWLICNGQSLLRSIYAELFALLGTTYGAADGTHFSLPDYRDYSPMGAGSTVAVGSVAGTFLHAISPAEMPTHNHGINDPGHTHPPGGGATSFWGVGSGTGVGGGSTSRSVANTGTNSTGISTQNAGSSTPMSLLHPVRGMNFIMFSGVF